MPTQIVTKDNLGKTLALENLETQKIDVNIDESTITADPGTGQLSATSILTSIVDAVNSFVYTDENAGDTTVTKVATNVLTLDPIAKTITSTVNGVVSNTLDISALYADINVASLDSSQSSNYIWKIIETDGTEHILDLSSLVAINTANSTSVTLQGDGTKLSPLNAQVKASPDADNLFEITTNGGKVAEADIKALHTAEVEVQDAFGVTLYHAHTDQTTN